jgi:uncharacterized repeat protein (TIGR01451 family)
VKYKEKAMTGHDKAMKRWCAAFAVIATLLLQSSGSHAQVPNASAMTMTVRNLTLAHDSARAKPRKSGDALMNDTLRYELNFRNPQPIALRNVVFENPLPSNLLLIGGSVTTSAPARIEYSIDGGKTFAVQPMARTNVNGQMVERPALPEQYTHIRWTVVGDLAVGATVTAGYDARIGVRR